MNSGGSFRGGVTSIGKFENDAKRLLATTGAALVTTMLDYYRLPTDFPCMATRPEGSPLVRVRHVEAALWRHFGGQRDFLPYLALHEFEALLFSSIDELPKTLVAPAKAEGFAAIRKGFVTPEDINERPGHGPSDRILALFPGYRKRLHGPATARRIGLDKLRSECTHFNDWLAALEAFAASG